MSIKTLTIGTVVLYIASLVSFSCGKPSSYIDLQDDENISVFEVFSDVKVVQLETVKDLLISQIVKVLYLENCFFILDLQTQKIFRFDEYGHFVSKISARGKGPGEYNYITDFTIDTINNRVVLLDPAVARVHYFSLDGTHIETIPVVTEKIMGLNKVFVLNDSTLLLTSITNQQLLFVDSRTRIVLSKEFPFPGNALLSAFMPFYNTYQIGGETFTKPALSNKIYNITEGYPMFHFEFCFGKQNNTQQQVYNLISELKAGRAFYGPNEGVGTGKLLNHFIIEVFENNRFRLAILEFDNDFKHVVIDKHSGAIHVFNTFSEGINLFRFSLNGNYAIGFERGIRYYIQNHPEFSHRKYNFFNADILSEAERQIIANHDPMTQNPFLVVYRFRE